MTSLGVSTQSSEKGCNIMKVFFSPREILSLVLLLAMLRLSTQLAAHESLAPLATASDIDFTVEYSTNTLMLGDILYAKITVRNKKSHVVRFSKFDAVVIRAETLVAKELVCGFGEYPGGTSLLELTPGQEIVYTRILDMFGNDHEENGEFNPFDTELSGQWVSLCAQRATVMPDQMGDVDYRKFLMEDKHKIQFGPPLIAKTAFDEAVADRLKRPELKPLMLYFDYLQTSYFFNFTTDRRDLEGNRRSFAAGLKVMSEDFPKQSSARRASSILSLVDRFMDTNGDVEDQAISSILSHIAESPTVERHFWRSYLLRKLESESATNGDGGIINKRKLELFSQRLTEAGL